VGASGGHSEPTPRRIEPWPLAVLGGLGSMIVICIAVFAVARAHVDPVVVDDAYAAGLRVNETLRADLRAEALGVEMVLAGHIEDDAVRLRVALRDGSGAPFEASRVVVRRERPAEGGLDADFELALRGDAFEGEIPLPLPGRWRLRVHAEVEGETLRRVFWIEAPEASA
jgi:nitrogen fixation protein FixH